MASLAFLVIAAIASLFMAWTIGAGSSGSTPFAPAVGANAISVMRAGFIVGVLGLAGAILQGQNVSEAVGRELVKGITLSPLAATIGLLLAALLVAIGVFTGYPIATSFTVTGAVIGVGLAIGGSPAWLKYREIGLLWTLTPVIAGGFAYGIARWLRTDDVPEEIAVPVLAGFTGMIIANIEFALLGAAGEAASIASVITDSLPVDWSGLLLAVTIAFGGGCAGLLRYDMHANATRSQRRFLLLLGGLVAFSAGGSQVGLAIGPLLPLLDPFSIPLVAVLIGGGIGLLIGSWTGAPRMIKAIAQDYSSLGPRRSIAALIPSFIIAQIAIFYGIPVSFNEIIVSAVIGSGYAAGDSGMGWRKIGYTIFAWVASLVTAGVAGYVIIIGVTALI